MIRKFQPTDLDDLLSVWEAASAVAHDFLDAKFLQQERRNISNLYLPKAETWVWEVGGSVVGFIALIGNEVGALFVDPSYHRTGIGISLMDKARELREELEVEVFKRNALGRAFYDRYGFELMQERVHEATGLTVMRLKLAGNHVAS